MPRGGARNRSGPPASEKSERSDRRGFKLTALPAEGYDGPIPGFPLPRRTVWWEYFADKQKVREVDDAATDGVWERELALWEWAWRTPQACAWSMPSERWRLMTIGHWVRTMVICETSEATAADKNSLHRFADQIGMTTAGLAEMGWKVAVDETAERRPEPAELDAPAPPAPVRRMRAVGDGN